MNKYKNKSAIVFFIISYLFVSVSFSGDFIMPNFDKKIYFGHQSVGENILDGILDVSGGGIFIKKIENNLIENSTNGIYHSQIGENGYPQKKIDHFVEFIDDNNENIDIAFFKFCYVDIDKNTDVNALFNNYKTSMDMLISKYPYIQFVHLTAPLRVVQSGPKAWVKKIIGRPLGGAEDNIKRIEYNQLLKNHYQGKKSIFDLALIESTLPSGKLSTFSHEGKDHMSLVSEYTDDGMHLNEVGRKIVAKKLIAFLTDF